MVGGGLSFMLTSFGFISKNHLFLVFAFGDKNFGANRGSFNHGLAESNFLAINY